MRNKFLPATAIFLTGMCLLPCGCKKASTLSKIIQQKLACDVAQYNIYLVGTSTPNVTLFQKTYDAQGKTVTEITCDFFEPYGSLLNGAYTFGPQHDLIVSKNDSSLVLRDKNNLADTVMLVLFNKDGRPVSSITSPLGNLTDTHNLIADTETFAYKGGRIFSVKTADFQEEVDTVRYDSLGNLRSFAGNGYIYDYDVQASESFYMMDYQLRSHGYYLLQYLGYFPEVTNSAYIRRSFTGSTLMVQANFGEEQYDPAGRLTGFNTHYIIGSMFGGTLWNTAVTYHCQ